MADDEDEPHRVMVDYRLEVLRSLGRLEGSLDALHKRDNRIEEQLTALRDTHDHHARRIGDLESFRRQILTIVGIVSATVGAGVTALINWFNKGGPPNG